MEQQDQSQWDGKQPDPLTQRKEGWYDKLLERIPLTVKTMNLIIALLFILLIAALTIGYLKGNGII